MMKKIFCIICVTICISLSGCGNAEGIDIPDDDPTSPVLVFKIIPNGSESGLDTIFLSRDKIQWYNVTTKEVRFTDNYAIAQSISFATYQKVQFYIGGNYLFSCLMFAAGINSETSSSLVFYYSSTENRFYLKDGYPDVSLLSNAEEEQRLRDQNMEKIANQWALFINQLKQEGRYIE